MSRLEQVRDHFLQKVYCEQLQRQLACSKYVASRTNSCPVVQGTRLAKNNVIHHQVPKQYSSPRKNPVHNSSLTLNQSLPNHNQHLPTRQCAPRMTRVKSLGNVSLMAQAFPNPFLVPSRKHSIGPHDHTMAQACPPRSSDGTPKVNMQPNNKSYVKRSRSESKPVLPNSTGSDRRVSVTTQGDQRWQCQLCKRKFTAKERFEKHTQICEKTFNKKRPVFNSIHQRLNEPKEITEDSPPKEVRQNYSNIQFEFRLILQKNCTHIFVSSAIYGLPLILVLCLQNDVDVAKPGKADDQRTSAVSNGNWKATRQQFLDDIRNARLKNKMNTALEDEISIHVAIAPGHKSEPLPHSDNETCFITKL